jgi:hypothetical protein
MRAENLQGRAKWFLYWKFGSNFKTYSKHFKKVKVDGEHEAHVGKKKHQMGSLGNYVFKPSLPTLH